jgi:hypothetical protein
VLIDWFRSKVSTKRSETKRNEQTNENGKRSGKESGGRCVAQATVHVDVELRLRLCFVVCESTEPCQLPCCNVGELLQNLLPCPFDISNTAGKKRKPISSSNLFWLFNPIPFHSTRFHSTIFQYTQSNPPQFGFQPKRKRPGRTFPFWW